MATNKSRGTSISRYNVVATYGSGKVGNARLYQKGDRSYVRAAYNGSINNPRSDAQMRQRLHFASLSNFYKMLSANVGTFMENKTPYLSSSNIFIRDNQGKGVYFTKMQTSNRFQVLEDGVRISSGSLMDIRLEPVDYSVTSSLAVGECNFSCWKSNIYLGRHDNMDNLSIQTVGEFAVVLVANNPELKYGDTFSWITFKQTGTISSSFVGKPYRVIPQINSIVLNPNDTTPFILGNWNTQFSPQTGLVSCGTIVEKQGSAAIYDYYLGYAKPISLGSNVPALGKNCPDMTGVAFLFYRNENGGKFTNSFIAANNQTAIDYFTSASQFQEARASYGAAESKNPFASSSVLIQTQPIGEGGSGTADDKIEMTGAGTYAKGETVTVSASMKSGATGYTFTSLGTSLPEENTIISSTSNSITFVANKSCVVGCILVEAD